MPRSLAPQHSPWIARPNRQVMTRITTGAQPPAAAPSPRQGLERPAVPVGIVARPVAGLATPGRGEADGAGQQAVGGGSEMAQRDAGRPGRGPDHSGEAGPGDQRHHRQGGAVRVAARRHRRIRSARSSGRITPANRRRNRRSFRSGSGCRAGRGALSGTAIAHLAESVSTIPAQSRTAGQARPGQGHGRPCL